MKISDYSYNLPKERIALYPLTDRSQSKLLVYDRGAISHKRFHELPSLLQKNALLFFNDTKVIPARLHFSKATGAEIEIFLLTPVEPSPLHAIAMQANNRTVWECTIGNLKRWAPSTSLIKDFQGTNVEAVLLDKARGLVEFKWQGEKNFAEVISAGGETPLPPYLNRDADESDKERYQTVYSRFEGAVAAPTAGLHFTNQVLQDLARQKIQTDFLTLHVSAGTFQPVKAENVAEHKMHHEQIIVTRKNIENLMQRDKFFIPVGTTSLRTIESLYWFGVRLLKNRNASFDISQEEPYENETETDRNSALAAVRDFMTRNRIEKLAGSTAIFIKPGYKFRMAQALITNFHQPESTLMLLVAAFVGDDWLKIYNEALRNDYRFLSYGDSSLLIPAK